MLIADTAIIYLFLEGLHDLHTKDSEIHEHDDDCDRGSGGREHKDVWLTSRLLSGCLGKLLIHRLSAHLICVFM